MSHILAWLHVSMSHILFFYSHFTHSRITSHVLALRLISMSHIVALLHIYSHYSRVTSNICVTYSRMTSHIYVTTTLFFYSHFTHSRSIANTNRRSKKVESRHIYARVDPCLAFGMLHIWCYLYESSHSPLRICLWDNERENENKGGSQRVASEYTYRPRLERKAQIIVKTRAYLRFSQGNRALPGFEVLWIYPRFTLQALWESNMGVDPYLDLAVATLHLCEFGLSIACVCRLRVCIFEMSIHVWSIRHVNPWHDDRECEGQCMCRIEWEREVGGWGRVPFSRNLMSPTPRRKWYLTTGRRAH